MLTVPTGLDDLLREIQAESTRNASDHEYAVGELVSRLVVSSAPRFLTLTLDSVKRWADLSISGCGMRFAKDEASSKESLAFEAVGRTALVFSLLTFDEKAFEADVRRLLVWSLAVKPERRASRPVCRASKVVMGVAAIGAAVVLIRYIDTLIVYQGPVV